MKVRQVCHIALKRDHEFIDTVRGDTEETHSQVGSVDLVYFLYKSDTIRLYFYTS